MAPSLRNALIISTFISCSLSIPTFESPPRTALHSTSSYPSKEKPTGPFRKLRDAIIERIWAIPSRSSPKSSCTTSHIRAPENFRARYGGDVVLRFQVHTEHEAKALSEAAGILYLDVWDATEDWIDIRIAKDVLPSFIGLLPPSLQDSYTPLMHDLARAVYDTYPNTPSSDGSPHMQSHATSHGWQTTVGTPQDLFFQDYQPLSVLHPWLRLLTSLFPTHSALTSIGVSAEGRDIPALRIGARMDDGDGDTPRSKPTLLIVGGSHAREWISVSTTAFVAHSLVTRYGHPRFSHVTKLLEHFDVVFVPILNPDGYEYTWTTDRLWRKNRQATSLPFCPGIDLDRSFSFGWDGHGSMDNACSDAYAGPGPLAAAEAKALTEWARNETKNNNVTFVSYVDFHSYSQQVLYPYSYTCNVDPPNLEDLEEVALGIAKSFRLTNGHYYGVESACEGSITYGDKAKKSRIQTESQGGSALDFFYHDMDVKLSFQVKLRDTGTYGFLLPKSDIVPTGMEAYEAVVGLGRWILGNHGIEGTDDLSSVWGEEATTQTSQSSSHSQTNPISTAHPGGEEDGDEEDVGDEYELYEWDSELKRRRRK